MVLHGQEGYELFTWLYFGINRLFLKSNGSGAFWKFVVTDQKGSPKKIKGLIFWAKLRALQNSVRIREVKG